MRDVIDGSPAAAAGLLPGDALLALGKNKVSTYASVLRALEVARHGRALRLRYRKAGT